MKLNLSAPCPASLRVRGLLEAAGSLVIADGQLRFTRASGPSGWMAPKEGVSIPLDAVHLMDVGAGILRVQGAVESHSFSGAGAVRLGVGLLAGAASGGPVYAFSCSLQAGILGASGELAIGPRGLHFASTGALGESLGRGRWESAWGAVRYVEVKGRKVRIVQRGAEVSFDLEDAAGCARAISELMPVPPVQSEPEGAVWVGGGVLSLASGGMAPGHAYVDSDAILHFVGPGGRTKLGPCDKVLRLDPGARDRMQAANSEWSLRLDHEDSVVHFDQVAMRVAAPRGGGDERADLRLVVGRRERVRFRDDSGSHPTISRVWIEDGEREILVYLEEARGLPAVAEAAQLVVPMRSGEVRLLTRASAIEEVELSDAPLPVHNLFVGAERVFRVRLRRPLARDLQEVRQRGALRMDFGGREVRLLRLGMEPLTVPLVNLSIAGAAVRLVEALPVGEVVWLDVGTDVLNAALRAEVLGAHGKPPELLQSLRFLDESEKLRSSIQRAIYKLQRSQIETADQERGEERGEGHSGPLLDPQGAEPTTDPPSGPGRGVEPTGGFRIQH